MSHIIMASEKDAEEILALYKSQLGREYCPWDDHYPAMEHIKFDLSLDSLFIMRSVRGELLAAISIDHDEAVDCLDCWSSHLQPSGELARIAVDIAHQGQGIAGEMVRFAMNVLRERGCRSVHMLVNKHNRKALGAYKNLGFSIVGECFMYEQPFFCYEKKL